MLDPTLKIWVTRALYVAHGQLLGWVLVPKGLWKKDQEPQSHSHQPQDTVWAERTEFQSWWNSTQLGSHMCGQLPRWCQSTSLPTSEVRLLRPQRHIPDTRLSHRGSLREIRKPVLAQGKRQGPSQSAAGSLHITIHPLSHPEPPNHCRLHDNHLPFLPNTRDMDSPNQVVRGGCLDVSSPGLGGASPNAGRSLGLSSCQREVSSWSHGGCWVPPWLPIILGRRHQAPL